MDRLKSLPERFRGSSSLVLAKGILGKGRERFNKFVTNPGVVMGSSAFLVLEVGRAILAPETLSTSQDLSLGTIADGAISIGIGFLVAIVSKRVSSAFDYLYKNDPESRKVLDRYPTIF